MTNFEYIKENLSVDMLVDIIEWCGGYDLGIPSCDEGCDDEACGCANSCSHEKRERAVRRWLSEERI